MRLYLAEGRLLPDAWRPLEPITEQAAEERRARTRNSLRSRQPASLSIESAIQRGCRAAGSVELGIHLTVPRANSVGELIRRLQQNIGPWAGRSATIVSILLLSAREVG